MKNLKLIFFTLLMVFTISSFAQNGIKEKMKTTNIQTFQMEKDGKMITYKVKVVEKRKLPGMVKKNGKPRVERVTKMISIDNDTDKAYDRFIVLRYKKSPNDSFEIVGTKRGFAVNVDDRTLEYLVGEGTYVTDNRDDDYFIIDEFDKM